MANLGKGLCAYVNSSNGQGFVCFCITPMVAIVETSIRALTFTKTIENEQPADMQILFNVRARECFKNKFQEVSKQKCDHSTRSFCNFSIIFVHLFWV